MKFLFKNYYSLLRYSWYTAVNLLIFLFVFAAFNTPVLATEYQVRAVVTDSASNAPLENALIRYVIGNDTAELWTNADGIAEGTVTSLPPGYRFKPADYGLRVYPTAVESGATVYAEINNSDNKLPPVYIYNTLGQNVTGQLHQLSAGMYFISVRLNGKNFTQKLITGGGFKIETVLKTAVQVPRTKSVSPKITGSSQANVLIQKEGYKIRETSEWLDDGVLNEFNYKLTPFLDYIIHGSVWNQTGDYNPSNATLFFKAQGDTVRAVQVNANGTFSTTYRKAGTTNIKIWMTADGFTNGTISILDPDTFAVNGIIACAAPFLIPDTAEANLKDLAIPQGVVMEGLSNYYFTNDTLRQVLDGRLTPGTIKRNTPNEMWFLTYDRATGQPISQAGYDAANLVIDNLVAEEHQANGITLNLVYKTISDTIMSAANREGKQLIAYQTNISSGNGGYLLDNEGYILFHSASSNTGLYNVILEEIINEWARDIGPSGGTVQVLIENGTGRLNQLGRTAKHFKDTHYLGTRTYQLQK